MFIKTVVTRRVAVAGTVLAAIAGGGSVALASSSSSSNVYQGCLSHGGNLYRVKVNPHETPHCYGHDTPISWNQRGPQGPMGTPGAQGPAGPAGAQGPAGPSGLANLGVQTVTHSIDNNQAIADAVACPTGDIAISGGGGFVNGGGGIFLLQSIPSVTNGVPTGWQVIVANASGTTANYSVYAECVPAPSTGAQGHALNTQAQSAAGQTRDHVTATAIKP